MTAATSTLQVSEIFSSIQGESTRAGLPCTFVRLAGCNLQCRWCDTPYARQGGSSMTVREIIEQVAKAGLSLTEVTGGEPLLQEGTLDLLRGLLEGSTEVMLETNGSLDISVVPGNVIRIIDIKCPGSGMHEHMMMSNLDDLRATDELKFVIADRADYDWARTFVEHDKRCLQAGAIHFVPVIRSAGEQDAGLQAHQLADWMLSDPGLPKVRLSTQLHKLIWGPDTRR